MHTLEKVLLFLYLLVFSFGGLFILLGGRVFSLTIQKSLQITEVMPDPKGSDSIYEWIEITNFSSEIVNLKDWQLNSKVLPEAIIKPNEIVIFAHDVNAIKTLFGIENVIIKTTFTLNNTGGTIELTRVGESNKFTYPKAKENISFESLIGECGTIQMNLNGNSIGKQNTLCKSTTYAPQPLPTSKTTPSPTVKVIPTVTNSLKPSPTLTVAQPTITALPNEKLILNKVCPFPTGGFEFIEVKNISETKVNLSNWEISDTKGKEALPNIELLNGKSFTFYPSKITLNNDGDKITISNPSKTFSNILTYPKAKENQCFTPDSLSITNTPKVTVKSNINNSETTISVTKDTATLGVNTTNINSVKLGIKVELKIPRLFRIQFGL